LRLNRTPHIPQPPVYRRDIDGLRGVAVASVVLFHAGIPGFSGGYVGVDVFFVISGYLITLLLAVPVRKPPGLWLTDFYIRRGRRILPALLMTSVATTLVAAALLLPWDLTRFGIYLAATPVMLTNIAAWTDGTGYFYSNAAHVPLTHFWSIALEEQFYLIYPLTLVLIGRYLPRHKTATLILLAAASFAISVWGSYRHPTANYFLPPSRAWELLLGAVLASAAQFRINGRIANEFLAGSSLFVLAFTVYAYGPATPYPGLYAIAPCAASATLILTGRSQSTLAGQLLSWRPFVFTGLISYSLYLWHFPALVLFGYYNILKIGSFELSVLLALTYMVAIVSYRWVEAPVRARTILNSNRRFLLTALALSVVIFAMGVTFLESGGLPRRFPPELRARGHLWLVDRGELVKCMNLPLGQIAAGGLCSFGAADTKAPRALVWGDSHAMALFPAYEKLALSHHLRLYFAANASCRPLLGLRNRSQDEATRNRCVQFNAAVAQAVRHLDPQLLILNAHWIDADADLVPEFVSGVPTESNFQRGLLATLRETESSRRFVCVVMDVPTLEYDLPYALGVARKRGMPHDFLKLSRHQALEQFRGPEGDIRALEQRGLLKFVDPKKALCRTDSCDIESDGKPLYGDRDHLSWAGAQLVSGEINGCFGDNEFQPLIGAKGSR